MASSSYRHIRLAREKPTRSSIYESAIKNHAWFDPLSEINRDLRIIEQSIGDCREKAGMPGRSQDHFKRMLELFTCARESLLDIKKQYLKTAT